MSSQTLIMFINHYLPTVAQDELSVASVPTSLYVAPGVCASYGIRGTGRCFNSSNEINFVVE
jgi:hypothetical protein